MRKRSIPLIVLTSVLSLRALAAAPGEFVPARYDPFVGDWLPKTAGDCVAQAFSTGSNAYQVNVLVAFDDESGGEPVVVLNGTRPDEKSAVELSGGAGDWTGAIRPDCCGSPRMEISNSKTGGTMRFSQFMRPNPRLRMKPPPGASVLFGDRMKDGVFTLAASEGKLTSGEAFGNSRVHLEFRMLSDKSAGAVTMWKNMWTSLVPSYGRKVAAACGSIESLFPSVRAERAVLEWQALDVETLDGRVTAFLNGVKIHDNAGGIVETGKRAPLEIETRGEPVEFRNIWVEAK